MGLNSYLVQETISIHLCIDVHNKQPNLPVKVSGRREKGPNYPVYSDNQTRSGKMWTVAFCPSLLLGTVRPHRKMVPGRETSCPGSLACVLWPAKTVLFLSSCHSVLCPLACQDSHLLVLLPLWPAGLCLLASFCPLATLACVLFLFFHSDLCPLAKPVLFSRRKIERGNEKWVFCRGTSNQGRIGLRLWIDMSICAPNVRVEVINDQNDENVIPDPLFSKYHKMGPKKYPNIFVFQRKDQTNILI